ncbi:MAG: response regulator [candidate division Zixibacteria bacterium]|nr:response regulator [candidate division Zixibacteria bacterium]
MLKAMKQILVVGSDPKISQDLDRYFDPREFKLLACPHGRSMIASLSNAKPDLVILDFDSVDQSGTEMVKKIREVDSGLPLIVLSRNPIGQRRKTTQEDYAVIPPSFQMEKVASMVKEALSTRTPRQTQKVLLGSVRVPGQAKSRVRVENDPRRAPEDSQSDDQDYHHLFDQVLSPVFDQIIRDCRGHVYDRLLSGLEKTMLAEVLKYVNHNQVKASQLLGISRNTLRERMKRYDIF